VSRIRAGLGGAGFVLALIAAGAALGGLVGAVWGWPDVLNHFAPVWLAAAWLGALLARAALARGRLRTAALGLAAVAVLVSGTPMVVEAVKSLRQPVPAAEGLKVLTFNRLWTNREHAKVVAMVRATGADLVAMQEADGFEAPAAIALKDLYPYQFACPTCDTLILSRRPILAQGRDDQGRHTLDLIWIKTTDAAGRPVTLATVHLFWPVPPWLQRVQRERLARVIRPLADGHLILTGDFNSTPWSFAMRGLDRSLAPLTRRTHGVVTFAANWPVPVLALDQVYAGPAWRAAKVERLASAGSDHYPLLVTLGR
jgi:endonuclease/exonuclease/phosphatase (EEP) superfamily protein YafD